MKVSGSSIAVYYAGKALALDGQPVQQVQAVTHQYLRHYKRPLPPNEQVLEGELLNNRRRHERPENGQHSEQRSEEPLEAQPSSELSPPADRYSSNLAIRNYQSTAQLDGFSRSGSVNQVDIYV